MKQESTPKSIGIIMDGNRRWAKEKGLPVYEGHSFGFEKLKEVVRWAKEAGVSYITVFAFSTENWKRAEDEVGYLMKLFERVLENEIDELKKENVRLQFIGSREKFSPKLQKLMDATEKDTRGNTAITLLCAVSYGGRQEIVDAVKKIVATGETDIT